MKILMMLIGFVFAASCYGNLSVEAISTAVNQDLSGTASHPTAGPARQTKSIVRETRSRTPLPTSISRARREDSSWQLVLFFRSTCPHCQNFDPAIADFIKESGLHAYAFTTDGGTLPDFPHPLPASPTILNKFFPDGNIIVPAVFLVENKTMRIVPISEGEIPENDLALRVQQVMSDKNNSGGLQ